MRQLPGMKGRVLLDGSFLPASKGNVSSSLHYNRTTVQYNSTVQQHSTTAQYNGTVQRYSTTVQYNSTVQQYSTTVQYNSTLQQYTTTVQYNFVIFPVIIIILPPHYIGRHLTFIDI